jgi:hypothetical protein
VQCHRAHTGVPPASLAPALPYLPLPSAAVEDNAWAKPNGTVVAVSPQATGDPWRQRLDLDPAKGGGRRTAAGLPLSGRTMVVSRRRLCRCRVRWAGLEAVVLLLFLAGGVDLWRRLWLWLCITRTPGVTILGLVVVVSSFAGSGRPGSWLDWQISFRHLVPTASWGGEAAGENRALTPVSAGNGGIPGVVALLKASPMQLLATHSCYSGANPISGYPGSNDDDALASLYLLRASFLEQCRLVEASGGVVFINHVAAESQWHGAAGPR